MDCQKPVGATEDVLQGRGATDAAGGRTQFLPQQHDGGGPLREHRQDVVEEAGCLTLKAAHTIELRLGHGWCVYAAPSAVCCPTARHQNRTQRIR